MQVRTRQLELFIRVCELGSISRAAEQLHIAQPALGMQVRHLEHEFGAELITRHSRGVAPTAAGTIVLKAARDVLRRMQDARAAVKAGRLQMRRTVTVGLSPSMATMLATRIITEAACLDGVTVHLVEELSHVLAELAETERLDVALAYSVGIGRLTSVPLLREQLFLVAARDGTTPETTEVDLVEALSGPLALPGPRDSVRKTVEEAARAHGLSFSVRYEIQSITAIKQLVSAGLATSILPWGTVRREVEAGEIAATPVDSPGLFRTLFLVQAPGRDEPELWALLKRLTHGLVSDCVLPGQFQPIEHSMTVLNGGFKRRVAPPSRAA